MSNGQLSDQHSDVLSPAQIEDLKQAWLKGKGLSKLPPVANLIMRLIATVEQARRAFDLANRKWDEQQARAEAAEASLKVATDDTSWRDRAFDAEGERDALKATVVQLEERQRKAEAELARVTAGAAVMRQAMNTLFDKIKHGDQAHQDWLALAIYEHFHEALSSTSAGEGLLKRLEAAEVALLWAVNRDLIPGFLVDPWRSAMGETK